MAVLRFFTVHNSSEGENAFLQIAPYRGGRSGLGYDDNEVRRQTSVRQFDNPAFEAPFIKWRDSALDFEFFERFEMVSDVNISNDFMYSIIPSVGNDRFKSFLIKTAPILFSQGAHRSLIQLVTLLCNGIVLCFVI